MTPIRLHDRFETLSIDALIPYARNSRTHSPEQVAQIAASLREFGFTNPVLIDETGGIIAGHGRVMAARQAGLDRVPCLRLEGLTETQKRAYIIADNKLALNAGWDEDLLALEIKDLQGMDFDIDLLGFDASEIEQYIAMADATPDGETDPDEVPEVQAEAVTKPGDVWLLGKHRIMCGDSTNAEQVARLMNGEKASACLTDPPYGLGKKMSGGTWATNDSNYAEMHEWDRVADQRFFDAVSALEIPSIVWGGNYSLCPPSRGWLIWNKPYFPTMSDCELAWTNMDMNAKRFDGPRVHQSDGKKQHPTQKPVDLMVWCLGYFKDCDSVVDIFSGSGTTIIAAEQTGRRCYAMELSPQYVDVAVRRWQRFTGKTATLEATGASFPGDA
jgi:hypothetical protein